MEKQSIVKIDFDLEIRKIQSDVLFTLKTAKKVVLFSFYRLILIQFFMGNWFAVYVEDLKWGRTVVLGRFAQKDHIKYASKKPTALYCYGH